MTIVKDTLSTHTYIRQHAEKNISKPINLLQTFGLGYIFDSSILMSPTFQQNNLQQNRELVVTPILQPKQSDPGV